MSGAGNNNLYDEDTATELREAFSAGTKGKPTMGLKELCKALHWLGLNPTPQEMADQISKNGAGQTMTCDQFLKSMTSTVADAKSTEDVVQAFSVFDKDGRGFVSASDLRHVLTALGDRLDEEQVEEMLKTAMGAGHGEGALNYKAFVSSVLKQ